MRLAGNLDLDLATMHQAASSGLASLFQLAEANAHIPLVTGLAVISDSESVTFTSKGDVTLKILNKFYLPTRVFRVRIIQVYCYLGTVVAMSCDFISESRQCLGG
jgi:hypothetical protein